MRANILVAVGLFCVSQPVMGGETRIVEDGQEAPSATLADAEWLLGRWAGMGLGAPIYESWLPPLGGIMVGSFVLGDGQGGVSLTEHRYLVEKDGSLVLRLKHFGPDFRPREGEDEPVDRDLVAVEPCALYFDGLTFRCDGEDGMVLAVRRGADAEEVFLRYTRRLGDGE